VVAGRSFVGGDPAKMQNLGECCIGQERREVLQPALHLWVWDLSDAVAGQDGTVGPEPEACPH